MLTNFPQIAHQHGRETPDLVQSLSNELNRDIKYFQHKPLMQQVAIRGECPIDEINQGLERILS